MTAIKIGKLATAEIIAAVAAVLCENPHLPAILDPVMASTSGRTLLEAGAIAAIRRDLLPLCRLVIPTLIELALLSAKQAVDDDGAIRQGRELLAAGARALLIEVAMHREPNRPIFLLRSDHEPTTSTHRALPHQCAGRTACWPARLRRIWRK
ncbi:hypothetical protein MesoLjLa_66760 (plasmid) [Mesorhizobium sp. L-2-11]|nr:hypothetical protein MesoLjLa_66760 [Mesorhizobium sp. L-2-11]